MQQFEEHLMVCEACLEKVRRFQDLAPVLRDDAEAVDIVTQTLAETASGGEQSQNSIWARLWPKASLPFKPAFLYAVIIMLLIPAVSTLIPTRGEKDSRLQTIHLVDLRSGNGQMAFSAAEGLDGVIVIVFSKALPNQKYDIAISDTHGKTVVHIEHFDGFNVLGTGYLLFPKENMIAGEYTLTISQYREGERSILKTYDFTVVQ